MNCFFLGKTKDTDRCSREGTVCFTIPELGVLFKTRYFGSSFECEYMSLLTLLVFIERNSEIFNQHKINIYTDNPLIVHQMNKAGFCSQDIRRHRDKALTYRQKFSYSLSWIPSYENQARNLALKQSTEDHQFNPNSDILARLNQDQG